MERQGYIHRSAEEWQAIIERQKVSGQSGAVYCRENNISPGCFYKWRRQLSGRDRSDSSAAGGKFIRLNTAPVSLAGRLVIETPAGYRIDARDGCSYDLLAAAVRAVSGQ